MISNAADWLERQYKANGTPTTLTEGQRRCVEVLSSLGALYNLHVPLGVTESIELHPHYVSVLLRGEVATTDLDGLTRLVLAAHQHHVRVAIKPWASHLDPVRAKLIVEDYREEYDIEVDPDTIPGIMEVFLSQRQSEGDTYTLHPGLDDLIAAATKMKEG